MKNLEGKVAILTGAASGIGRATSLLLAREGCLVALADINAEDLAQTASAIEVAGGTASIHRADVSNQDSVHKLADDVMARHGHAHVLLNIAGRPPIALI
jgi:NAD(P)-dependent dehydrogenase (short-subunit alcohol dehydrogenase family)